MTDLVQFGSSPVSGMSVLRRVGRSRIVVGRAKRGAYPSQKMLKNTEKNVFTYSKMRKNKPFSHSRIR